MDGMRTDVLGAKGKNRDKASLVGWKHRFSRNNQTMIIVALMGAIVFYIALYCLWAASSQHLNTVQEWLAMLNTMAFMPGHLVFVILRGLILVTALYVFADALRAGVKNTLRKRREAKRDTEEPFAVGTKRPPVA